MGMIKGMNANINNLNNMNNMLFDLNTNSNSINIINNNIFNMNNNHNNMNIFRKIIILIMKLIKIITNLIIIMDLIVI